MAKIKMKTTLKTKDNLINCDVLAIKNNNHYSYLEEGVTVVLNVYTDSIKMQRKKDDYELFFLFNKNGESSCTINLGNYTTNLKIKLKELDIRDNDITIIYMIDKDEFNYHITY